MYDEGLLAVRGQTEGRQNAIRPKSLELAVEIRRYPVD
jgi:hypothetical protein